MSAMTKHEDKLAAAMSAIDDVVNDESASEAKKQESLLAIKVQIEKLLGRPMSKYQILVIRLLRAILERQVYPREWFTREIDREHQVLTSDAYLFVGSIPRAVDTCPVSSDHE